MTTYTNLLNGLILLSSLASGAVFADMNSLNVGDSFAYKTQKTVAVDIQINTGANEESGLSFYSQGAGGLRLLDSRMVDSSGHYSGKLRIPASLKTIVVRSRWLDSFKEVKVAITKNQVNTVIDNF